MDIQFNQVGYAYQGFKKVFHALKDINLNIAAKGEFVAILGHTGSGKTTLVQHMNVLLKPTSGNINILGTIIPQKNKQKINHIRQKVGLVFQFPEYQLFEINILKDVEFGPSNFKQTKPFATTYAKEALQTVGIDESLYSESPFRISGGQMRRVAIAGILAMKPEILVLDEPTRGLDPQGKDDIMDLFNKIHKEENKSIIMISHDMDIVAKYAKRVIVLNQGEIVFDGTKHELFTHPNFDTFHLDYPTPMKIMNHLSKTIGLEKKLVLTQDELLAHLKKEAK